MADSLFDNRYRYDYIYPRGRSGETLRAQDTANNDRLVVIKRPAPNDAPPIRAGQEVSILNERKALQRLSGHAVLTEVLDSGQFFVGGMPHQYIVMERAEGRIIADEVTTLARSGERLPELEMLVIIDHLLDLLAAAHERDIVYNDVDAKHLFWNRETYRLKVIDWGNAVFLEGDEITPQGVSRQSDIAQVGELVFFITTGGRRAEIPRDVDDGFLLDFGDEPVSERLCQIVSKAVHPNLRLRYQTITELRQELTRYRAPLERDRSTIVQHVTERLRRDLSKNDLRGLANTLEPALNLDPGYPPARKANDEINDRLRDLDVSADLDAVRIYMEGGNWSRAADLLSELRDKAGPQTSNLVELLLDCSVLLLENDLHPVPPAVLDAIVLIFDEHILHAAHTLLTQTNPNPKGHRLQWLLAERISSRIPDILLLRPNLFRLELALGNLEEDGVNISDARSKLAEIRHMLDQLPGEAATNLSQLRDSYRAVVDQLTTLHKVLLTVVVQHSLPHRKLPLTTLDRALNATMALADNMHVIGKQATSSPRDATVALDSSRAIDPNNDLWDSIDRLLNSLYELLQSYQTYVPAADGSDLIDWLKSARQDLSPFDERLFDPMLSGMTTGLDVAETSWQRYADAVLLGDRNEALQALHEAMRAVGTISPTLSGWFNQLRSVIDGAGYVERHAIHGGLGRALADGWEAFDRGRLTDAERLAQQAADITRTETERYAVERLLQLANLAREWVERNGILDSTRTQSVLNNIEALYTPAEASVRDNFAGQMPSRETYLRAMNRGLIEIYRDTSSAGLRIYFSNAVLLGALECHDGNLDDAGFWRQAAIIALGSHGASHILTRTLDDFIARRRNLNTAADLLNTVDNRETLEELADIRRQIEDNPQSRLLAAGVHSLRELELALREWFDGEFRAAGLKIESALKAVDELEKAASVTVSAYRHFLEQLQAAAAELHNLARQMRQAVERRPAEPVEIIYEAHRRQAETTEYLLGSARAAQLKQWYDTYRAFLDVYIDTSVRRSARLERFNELFKAMFIDRHPAYPLYRRWYDLTDGAPEFPAPPTDEPTPRMDESAPEEPVEPPLVEPVAAATGRRMLPLRLIVIALLALLVMVAAYVIMNSSGGDDDEGDAPVVVAASQTMTESAAIVTVEATAEIETAIASDPTTSADNPTVTDALPTATVATATPTETVIPTDTPTETPSPTVTASPTPTPTLPPQGLQGWQDLLALSRRLDDPAWDSELFSPVAGSSNWRLGVGSTGDGTEGEQAEIMLDFDMLDLYYGNNAPSRILRTEATLSLTTYDPSLLDNSDVYFGLMLQSADDPTRRVGIYIEVISLNILNLWIVDGDESTPRRQVTVTSVNPRLRIERDSANGRITLFYNDSQLGEPIPFVGVDDPIEPALFIRDSGVIVTVVSWRLGLR